jgi:hypothetical protein
MKLPIPDDWDGESWHCVQIRWPDSEGYNGLLRGFLSQMTRGRFWDENSGVIKDAQAVGWQVFDENWPFIVCGQQDNNGNGSDSGGDSQPSGGGCGCIGEWDMPCIDISSLLKIENGKLWVRNGCCEWVEVGDISSAQGATPTDSPEDFVDPGTGETLTKDEVDCRIAAGIAERWYELGLSCLAAPYHSFPWNWYKYVKERNADLELDESLISKACGIVFAEGVLSAFAEEDLIPLADMELDDKQRLICEFKAVMYDFRAAGSWFHEDMRTAMRSRVGQLSGNPVLREFRLAVFDAMAGPSLMRIAGDSVYGQDVDCDCPAEDVSGETTPDGNGWYLSDDQSSAAVYIPKDETGWNIAGVPGTPTHDVYGVFFRIASNATGIIKRSSWTSSGGDEGSLPPVDTSLSPDTSDHLESLGLYCAFIQLNDDAICASLAGSRGIGCYHKLTGGADSPIIGSPEAPQPASGTLGFRLNSYDDTTLEITELRWIHNINSPSHSA